MSCPSSLFHDAAAKSNSQPQWLSMSDQVQPSIWERSTLARFFRWLFSWRAIRSILIVLAWIATIIALLYGEENWRGRRAWNKYRRELEARGEQLDYKAFIPPAVPDEQNFAATP